MNRHHIVRVGLVLALAASVVSMTIAVIPEKSGIRIPVRCANGRMGFIDDTGRMVLPAKWTSATPFTQDGTCHVISEKSSRKYGFQFRGYFPSFKTWVTRGDEYWKMDRLGNLDSYPRIQVSQRDPKTQPTEPDSHGMSMIRERGKFRWVKTDGSEAFPGTWERAINFKNEDPAAVYNGSRWGFINRKGEAVTPCEWEQTHGFDGNGRACVSVNNKWGVLNPQGKLFVPLYFKYLSGFDAKSMCAAQLDSGSGFIDPAGKIVIPFRHVRVEPFDPFDMAEVVMRDDDDKLRVGWIDRSGKLVIPCIYHDHAPEWIWRFKDHELLPVCDHKGFGLIDRRGRVVVPTGSGPLAHVEDPIAPGRFWITRVPVYSALKPGSVSIKPACYDQDGKLIWQGYAWTRTQIAYVGLCVFGAISVLLFILMKRLGPAEHSNTA